MQVRSKWTAEVDSLPVPSTLDIQMAHLLDTMFKKDSSQECSPSK